MSNLEPNLPDEPRIRWSFGLITIIVIIFAAVILRVVQWVLPAETIPLLPQAEGMIQTGSPVQAEPFAAHPILLPTDLLGAEIQVVGVYPHASEEIAEGSVAVEFTRNGWRFVELFQQPVALETVLAPYARFSREEIALSASINGTLIDFGRRYTQCRENTEGLPGVCQISKILAFELDGRTITLGADGAHASTGELITLARSLVQAASTSAP